MAANWELVWADEFDYEGLPDPARWDYEEGFVRNRELQYYTRARLENARVGNGLLTIEARRENWPNPRYRPGSDNWQEERSQAAYTAASLVTRYQWAWTYGRFEIRAKLPHGQGIWPAIWTLGANRDTLGWPACGEIDIMEFVGKEPDHVHATVHYGTKTDHRFLHGQVVTPSPFADFHRYAVEWFPDRIDFFFDDDRYHRFLVDAAGPGPDNPFRQPHYLLLNLALGGSWGGELDDAVLPQQYLIDYVRVYRQA